LGNNVFVPGGTAHKSQTPKLLPGEIYSPTDDECQQVMTMIARMRDDAALRERCARARGWNPATLRELALEGYLGWHHGKLAFIYDTGVKLRWREKSERIIEWAFGKPWLWRGSYLNWGQKVYLCEGETDAITLIDAGFEREEKTLIAALPSATTFNPEWAQLFRAKDVVLVFDGDQPGNAATARVVGFLRLVVRSLSHLDWEGLRHAC
jgi:Toprim domain-containing protein